MSPFKEKLCNDSGFNTVHCIGVRDMSGIAAKRMLADSRELLRQDHGQIQMLMKIGNTVGEQMRMARQLRLFQVPRHGNDIDRVGVCITNSENHAAPEPAAPGGDIIIPVSIGWQQLDTIVIKAAQIANARSGGVTI
jgi:hypothetical protein